MSIRAKAKAVISVALVLASGAGALTWSLASPRAVAAPGRPEGRPGPTNAMLAACRRSAPESRCTVQEAGRPLMSGVCRAPPGLALACLPAVGPSRDRPPPPPGDGPGRQESQNDAEIAGTRVSTAAFGCSLSHDALNPSVGLPSRYAWSCGAGQRTLKANGVPDHPAGRFPNAGNPNRISAQVVIATLSLSPARTKGGSKFVKLSGYALNGVKFDPGTAESCTDRCENGGRGGGGRWRIEALGQRFFDFGVDANNAHVQPDGAYHYHGVPTGMLVGRPGGAQRMTLIGFAMDGFPIYARLGHSDPRSGSSPLRAMRPSYRLKAVADPGRPPVSIAPMGTFTQDYEFVAGLGDLDDCNGRTGVTPQFPGGIYYYLATDAYPYLPRCVKGAPSRSGRPDGPPRGFGPPPPGDKPTRNRP